jgi:hypothetical protein
LLGFDSTLELRLYEARLQFTNLMGDIVRLLTVGKDMVNHDKYICMARLDKRLDHWYESLSEVLKWSPSNIKHAPRSFFILQ